MKEGPVTLSFYSLELFARPGNNLEVLSAYEQCFMLIGFTMDCCFILQRNHVFYSME